MRKLTFIVIPANGQKPRQFAIPQFVIRFFYLAFFVGTFVFGFALLDYMSMRDMRNNYSMLQKENKNIKDEAQLLTTNLEEVKKSLRKVKDFTQKIGEIITFKIDRVSQHTGMGPLSAKEYSIATTSFLTPASASSQSVPLGINIDKLSFNPVLKELANVNNASKHSALDLQNLLSTLSQKKNLLASIPTVMPSKGWIASRYGSRISPFTGENAIHRGLDIAAPIGTPIYTPADGVVIFSGAKEGFGNFIMVAHYGSGIITRYGHNAQNLVHTGQKISRGDQIASVGMTGKTTGPHLHYEVWVNGHDTNPQKFILDSDDELF